MAALRPLTPVLTQPPVIEVEKDVNSLHNLLLSTIANTKVIDITKNVGGMYCHIHCHIRCHIPCHIHCHIPCHIHCHVHCHIHCHISTDKIPSHNVFVISYKVI